MGAALARLGGRLSAPTPLLLQTGEVQGWPWLSMTQLSGEPLTARWAGLSEPQKCALLSTLGALAAEVHCHMEREHLLAVLRVEELDAGEVLAGSEVPQAHLDRPVCEILGCEKQWSIESDTARGRSR